jgi:hypothetical protein
LDAVTTSLGLRAAFVDTIFLGIVIGVVIGVVADVAGGRVIGAVVRVVEG